MGLSELALRSARTRSVMLPRESGVAPASAGRPPNSKVPGALASGIEHQVCGIAQHGMLRGGGAVNEFVDTGAALYAALDDVDDGFVAEEVAAFGVRDDAGVEEKECVGDTSVDVERTGLVSVA